MIARGEPDAHEVHAEEVPGFGGGALRRPDAFVADGDAVLVKGSRVAGLERLVEAFA